MPLGTIFEATVEVPRRARSTRRLRDRLVSAVRFRPRRLRSHQVACGLVVAGPAGLEHGCDQLPDVDKLRRCWSSTSTGSRPSVRFFKDLATGAWKRFEPWMSTIADPDTGPVFSVVDGRDHEGVREWFFARSLGWRLGAQVGASDPSAVFRKALRMWLPRTAVSVDAFELVLLGNSMLTEVRQRLTQETKGRRGRTADPVGANRRLLLRVGETYSDRGCDRLNDFDIDDPTCKLQAA